MRHPNSIQSILASVEAHWSIDKTEAAHKTTILAYLRFNDEAQIVQQVFLPALIVPPQMLNKDLL